MLVIVTYDVKTETDEGKSRLRKVAKICDKYGQRVQNSVFECLVDATQYLELKHKLLEICKLDCDSIRFYLLGNSYKDRIESYGQKAAFDQDDILIL